MTIAQCCVPNSKTDTQLSLLIIQSCFRLVKWCLQVFFVVFLEQKLKGLLLRFFASNASIEQFVACGLQDIGSQMEFQRLVKEHTCHDEVNGSTVILTSASSQSSDSFKSRSSHGNVKPSRNTLRNMVPLDARIYNAKNVS